MLYKSLQQTIVEYEKRKKETQSEGDRKVFKWKVFALSFCILVIILIGILSQLVENHVEDQGEIHNLTFLPSLLKESQQLQSITSIKSMLYGLDKSQRIKYDKAETIIISDSLQISQLLEKINNKRSILFLFNLVQNIEAEDDKIYRFGMLLKRQYDSEVDPDDNNAIQIYDPADYLTSVYFSLNQAQALEMNLNSACKLYSFNKTTGDLLIMESLQFRHHQDKQENGKVQFGVMKHQCFGETETQAINEIRKLTGIELSSAKDIKNLVIQSVEVFYLSFEGQNAA